MKLAWTVGKRKRLFYGQKCYRLEMAIDSKMLVYGGVGDW